MKLSFAAAIVAGMLLIPAQGPAAGEGKPFPVDVWEPPFNQQRQHVRKQYVLLAHARKPWQLCASIPHLKDDYWLAVNSALIQEARRLEVRLNLFEAGGYEHLETQKRQIAECMHKGSDGLIVGAISADGLNDLIGFYASRGIPIVDLINGVSSQAIAARAAADFYDMGFAAGQALKKMAGADGRSVRIAWFPGPKGAGWVAAGNEGFRAAVKGTKIAIVETSFGDTGLAEQTKLVTAALDQYKDLDYIVGTAVTAEAAVPVLRERKMSAKTKVLSYYFGAGVYRGIQRGTIVAAPTDQPAIQAKLSVDLIVRILEKKHYLRHVSATVILVDSGSLPKFDLSSSLASPGFRPIFSTTE
jgi:periplasmic protein TorT